MYMHVYYVFLFCSWLLNDFILPSMWKSFEWSFVVCWISLDHCIRPPVVCASFNVPSPNRTFFFQYSENTYFTHKLPHFRVLTWPYSQHGSFHTVYVVASCCSSFLVAHISLAYRITGKMLQLKRMTWQILSIFALNISFIVVNVFHTDLIVCKIFVSIFCYIHPKLTNTFTSVRALKCIMAKL